MTCRKLTLLNRKKIFRFFSRRRIWSRVQRDSAAAQGPVGVDQGCKQNQTGARFNLHHLFTTRAWPGLVQFFSRTGTPLTCTTGFTRFYNACHVVSKHTCKPRVCESRLRVVSWWKTFRYSNSPLTDLVSVLPQWPPILTVASSTSVLAQVGPTGCQFSGIGRT